MSTYVGVSGSTEGWLPYANEIIRVYLDSEFERPHLERVAHSHSAYAHVVKGCPALNHYWAGPHASVSVDGARIVFASTWGGNCKVGTFWAW